MSVRRKTSSTLDLLKAAVSPAPPRAPDDSGWLPIGADASVLGRVLVGWAGHDESIFGRFHADAEGNAPCWRDGLGVPITPTPTHYRLIRGPAGSDDR